jgi:hypothetical protein
MPFAKTIPRFSSLAAIVLPAVLLLHGGSAVAQRNGTTLAAYKTLDICSVNATTWRYFGAVSLYNEGAVATEGLVITDKLQNKTGTVWIDGPTAFSVSGTVIPPGTTATTAVVFPYLIEGVPLDGLIRNVATITITNHSGSLGTPKGPEPKATFTGTVLPCPVPEPEGCTHTQGYWGNKPGVIWPYPHQRGDMFFMSGYTWQQVMDMPVNTATGYYQLAHQYMAAVLNRDVPTSVPAGVATTLALAEDWLGQNIPAACTANGSCGLQKDWAAVLDKYNNGVYPGGPKHCD